MHEDLGLTSKQFNSEYYTIRQLLLGDLFVCLVLFWGFNSDQTYILTKPITRGIYY